MGFDLSDYNQAKEFAEAHNFVNEKGQYYEGFKDAIRQAGGDASKFKGTESYNVMAISEGDTQPHIIASNLSKEEAQKVAQDEKGKYKQVTIQEAYNSVQYTSGQKKQTSTTGTYAKSSAIPKNYVPTIFSGNTSTAAEKVQSIKKTGYSTISEKVGAIKYANLPVENVNTNENYGGALPSIGMLAGAGSFASLLASNLISSDSISGMSGVYRTANATFEIINNLAVANDYDAERAAELVAEGIVSAFQNGKTITQLNQ